MRAPLRRVQPGAPITADNHNALVDAINALSNISTSFPLRLHRLPTGVHLGLAFEEKEALVELTSDLSIGGGATAKILWWDGTDWTESSAPEIEVHDAIGTFEGLAGDRALVRFHRQSGKWLVWQLKC